MPAQHNEKMLVSHSVRHARNYGIDSPDYRGSAGTRSAAHLAVQHGLGLLSQRRVGINSVDPDRASPDGKAVSFFHRTIDSGSGR